MNTYNENFMYKISPGCTNPTINHRCFNRIAIFENGSLYLHYEETGRPVARAENVKPVDLLVWVTCPHCHNTSWWEGLAEYLKFGNAVCETCGTICYAEDRSASKLAENCHLSIHK